MPANRSARLLTATQGEDDGVVVSR